MTVTKTSLLVTYLTNGATKIFPFSFLIDNADALKVELKNLSTGVTTLIPSSQYTADGFGDESGGTIVYPISGAAVPTGSQIIIYRDTPLTQEILLTNQTRYFPDVAMSAWDKLTLMVQEVNDKLRRAPLVPKETSDRDFLFPVPDAGRILVSRQDETGWEHGPTVSEISVAEEAAAIATAAKEFIESILGTTARRETITTFSDGTETTVELTGVPPDENYVSVYFDGIKQRAFEDWTLSTTSVLPLTKAVTFTAPTGSVVETEFLGAENVPESSFYLILDQIDLENGDVPIYDSVTERWINRPFTTGRLTDLDNDARTDGALWIYDEGTGKMVASPTLSNPNTIIDGATIQHKRLTAADAVPLLDGLAAGELALNVYDGKLFAKISDGTDRIVDLLHPHVFPSRASAQATRVPAWVDLITVMNDGVFLLYQRDDEGDALTTAGGATWAPFGDVYVDHWGCTRAQGLGAADSVADSGAAIQAAIDWCEATGYFGVLHLGPGYYRTTVPLDVPISLVLEGEGPNESYIHVDHLDGYGVRFYNQFSGFRSIGFTASATRRAGTVGLGDYGVYFAGEDVAEAGSGRLLYCVMEDAYFYGHPDDHVHIVGPAFTGSIERVSFSTCGGHGIYFDRGEKSGRTNLITGLISGICTISDCRFGSVAGHLICAGSPNGTYTGSDYSTPALRIVISNCEGSGATDAAVRYTNSALFLRGANHVVEHCGFSHANALAFVAGRNIHFTNNRLLGGTDEAGVIVGTYDELPTDGVWLKGFNVIGATGSMDPLVRFTLPTGEVTLPKNIFLEQGEMGNITTLFGVDATISSLRLVTGKYINEQTYDEYTYPKVLPLTADVTVNNSATAVSLADLSIPVRANETVRFEFVLEYEATTTADIKTSVAAPAGATYRYSGAGAMKVGAADTIDVHSTVTAAANINFGAAGTGSTRIATISGVCINGTTAGTITPRFAQLVAEASDCIVRAGITHAKVFR